jgi:hypothetical protein
MKPSSTKQQTQHLTNKNDGGGGVPCSDKERCPAWEKGCRAFMTHELMQRHVAQCKIYNAPAPDPSSPEEETYKYHYADTPTPGEKGNKKKESEHQRCNSGDVLPLRLFDGDDADVMPCYTLEDGDDETEEDHAENEEVILNDDDPLVDDKRFALEFDFSNNTNDSEFLDNNTNSMDSSFAASLSGDDTSNRQSETDSPSMALASSSEHTQSSSDLFSTSQHSQSFLNPNPIRTKLKDIQTRTMYTDRSPPANIPRDHKFGVELLKILPQQTPLYIYDRIIDLINETYDHVFTKPPKRTDVEYLLKERYHLKGLSPALSRVPLSDKGHSGPWVQVTTSSFVEGVNYLLHHIRNSPPESLLINADNPFVSPIEKFNDKTEFGEISTGIRFNRAYENCRKRHNNPRGIPLPIILEIDKSHIDASGKLTFEQLRQCIPWINRNEMYFPSSWVGLGAVPNSVIIPKSHHPKQVPQGRSSNRDYHAILNHILSEMKDVCRADGLVCDLLLPRRIPGTSEIELKVHENVTLYPYLLYVNGDTEGHNKLCSLKANSHRNCRVCDVLKKDSGRPDVTFTLREMSKVKRLVDRALEGEARANEKLDDLCIYATNNAFYEGVEFFDEITKRNSEIVAGIFGVTPAELLHYLQKGQYLYVFEGFYEQPPTKKEKEQLEKAKLKEKLAKQQESVDTDRGRKRKSRLSPVCQREPGESMLPQNKDGDDKKNNEKTRRSFAIPKSRHKLVNALAREVGTDITHGSEPNTPRLLFPHGVTSTTHRSCSEMTGIVLFMLILLNTQCGRKIAHIKEERVRNGWIEMLERFLLYEAFLKCTKPKTRKALLKIKAYLVYLMFLYKHVVDRSSRSKGDGDNIIKFHLTLHMVDMILLYGLPANFTGGPHESRHKYFAKACGATTQKNIRSLDFQITNRQLTALGLNRYEQELGRLCLTASDDVTVVETAEKVVLYGASQSYVHSRSKIFSIRTGEEQQWVDTILQDRVTNFLRQLCSQDYVKVSDDLTLTLCTELRKQRSNMTQTKLYRAHPNFSTDKTQEECSWFDWCYVKWPVLNDEGKDDLSDYPCHIRSFVRIPSGFFVSGRDYKGLESYTIEHPSSDVDYAIIETTGQQAQSMTTQHPKSWFFTKGTKFCTRDPSVPDLYLVPVSHLHGTLSAFRDPIDINPKTLEVQFRENGYIFMKQVDTWSERFVQLAEEFSNHSDDKRKKMTDLIRYSSIHNVFKQPDSELSDSSEDDEEDDFIDDDEDYYDESIPREKQDDLKDGVLMFNT